MVMNDERAANSESLSGLESVELRPGGRVEYQPDFLSPSQADRCFARLSSELDWAQRPIVLFGRELMQPRLTAFHGAPGISYRYSGQTMLARPWTPTLTELKERLQRVLGLDFNCVLCNLYRDGRDSMAWHADDEAELGPTPVIGSISLGAARRFQLKPRSGRGERIERILEHGSLLLMAGTLQQHWQHQLPKSLRVTEPRINLTFRRILSRAD